MALSLLEALPALSCGGFVFFIYPTVDQNGGVWWNPSEMNAGKSRDELYLRARLPP